MRRAGKLGDAWHVIGTRDLDELSAKMDRVRQVAAEAGRGEESVRLTARIGGRPGAEGAEILRKRFAALAELDCEHVVVDPSITDPADVLTFYRTLADLSEAVSG